MKNVEDDHSAETEVIAEVQNIVEWCKKQTVLPVADLSNTLLDSLKHAGRDVGQVFFNNSATSEYSTWNGQDFSVEINKLAVLYAACAVKRVAVRNFASCIINEVDVKNLYETYLTNSSIPQALLTNWINHKLGPNKDLIHLKSDDRFRDAFLKKMHDKAFIIMNVLDQLFQNNLCPQYLAFITRSICSVSEYESVIETWTNTMSDTDVQNKLEKNNASMISALSNILSFTASAKKFQEAVELSTRAIENVSEKLPIVHTLIGYVARDQLKDVTNLPPLGGNYHIGSDLNNTEIAAGLNAILASNNDFTQAAIRAANDYKHWEDPHISPFQSSKDHEIWGEKLANWLKSDQGPKAFDIATSSDPNNAQESWSTLAPIGVHTPYFLPVSGCFVHGTKILLDDHSSVGIEHLTVGQRIITRLDERMYLKPMSEMSPNIQYGIVSSERPGFICRQETQIFGFNSDMPFFTAEHVFYTLTGLRALDPATAMKENQFLNVGYLHVGDILLRASKENMYQYELVKIENFTQTVIPRGTRVFGVHLQEGLRSYHANDYLVWLNYPEITIDRAMKNINKIPRLSEKIETVKHVRKILPMLNRVLGPFTEQAVHAALTSDDHPLQRAAKSKYSTGHYGTTATVRNSKETVQHPLIPIDHELHLNNDSFKHRDDALDLGHRWTPMRHVTTNFNIEPRHDVNEMYHHKKSESRQLASVLLPKSISLVSGTLLIDQQYVNDVTIDDNSIRWTRKIIQQNVTPTKSLITNDDHTAEYEHGSIHFTPERFHGWGSIIHTTDREPADDHAHPENRLNFTATASLNEYKSNVSINKTFPDAKETNLPQIDNSIKWSDDLPYSLKLGVSDGKPVVQLFANNANIPIQAAFGHNDNNFLTLKIDIDPFSADIMADTLPADQIFISFYCVFSWDYAVFNGYAIRYDKNNMKGYCGEICAWAGKISTDHQTLVSSANQAVLTHVLKDNQLSSSSSSLFAITNDAKSMPSSPRSIISGASKATRLLSNTLTDLNLMDLITMSGPDENVLHETTQDLLKQATIYHVPDDWRKELFGETKPTTLDNRLTVIGEKQKRFLAEKFGVAWLCQGMCTNPTLSEKFPKDAQGKLQYFWKGRHEGSLASNKEYAELNEKAAIIAFEQLTPTLKRYIQSGEANTWAKNLFDRLMDDTTLNGLAVDVFFNGRVKVNKYCMVLHCLAPTEDYSSRLWKAVMMENVGIASTKYCGGNETKEFFDDVYQTLIVKILDNDPNVNKEIKAALKTDIEELMKSIEVDATKRTAEFLAKMSTLTAEIFDFYQKKTERGAVWTRLNKLKKWIDEKKLDVVGNFFNKLFSLTAFALGAVSTLGNLVNWSNLKPEQKAQAIVNCIYVVAKIIAKVPEAWESLISGVKDMKDGLAWVKAQCTCMRENLVLTQDVETPTVNQGVIAEEAAADVAKVESKWSMFFSMAETACKVLNLCVLIASMVVIGSEIINDFENNAPVALKVLDILQLICITITFHLEVASLLAGVAILPILSVAVAITGIVFAFVSLFIPKEPPPESPAERWIRETGAPFVKNCKLGEQKLQYICSPASPVKTNLKTDLQLTVKTRDTNAVYLNAVNFQISCGLTKPEELLTVDEKNIPKSSVNSNAVRVKTRYGENILSVLLQSAEGLFCVSENETIIVTIPNIQFSNQSGTSRLHIEEYCGDYKKTFDVINVSIDFVKQ